jgi:hypothetical protein
VSSLQSSYLSHTLNNVLDPRGDTSSGYYNREGVSLSCISHTFARRWRMQGFAPSHHSMERSYIAQFPIEHFRVTDQEILNRVLTADVSKGPWSANLIHGCNPSHAPNKGGHSSQPPPFPAKIRTIQLHMSFTPLSCMWQRSNPCVHVSWSVIPAENSSTSKSRPAQTCIQRGANSDFR